MSDNDDDIWAHDGLKVRDDGKVTGCAYTLDFEGGYDVTASVTSYQYDRDGETRMNHVPHVVVSAPGGGIVAEPHAHDSEDPEQAIERATSTAEAVFENPDHYI